MIMLLNINLKQLVSCRSLRRIILKDTVNQTNDLSKVINKTVLTVHWGILWE